MKRILSIFLAVAMLIGATSMIAFSASIRVTIRARSRNIGRDKTMQLEEVVRPDDTEYDDVEWRTSDDDIVEVDEYGEITGISPGTATITARIFNQGKRIGSGSIDITVPGRVSSEDDMDTDDDYSSSSKSSASSTAVKNANNAGKISTDTVTSAVKKNVKKGATTSATFKGYSSVSAATLQAASTNMKNAGGTVLLNFDTMSSTKANSVEGRVTLNPRSASNLKGDIKLGVFTNDKATGSTRTKFQKYFKNKVVIISASQKGNYGMSATYAVKIGTELKNSKNLMLYSYDPSTNKYYTIKNSNIWLDSNGYVHFTTNLGDYLVIADGNLVLK